MIMPHAACPIAFQLQGSLGPESQKLCRPAPAPHHIMKRSHSQMAAEDMTPLDQIVQGQLAKLTTSEQMHLRKVFDSAGGELTVASACSGSEVARVALASMQKGLEGLGIPCGWRSLFSCEREAQKQSWVQKVIEPGVGDCEGCIFNDFAHIGGPSAECAKHREQCPVASSFLFSAGISCKTLSKLYKQRAGLGPRCLVDSVGTSGKTCHNLIAHLRAHRPRVVIVENVEEPWGSGSSSRGAPSGSRTMASGTVGH